MDERAQELGKSSVSCVRQLHLQIEKPHRRLIRKGIIVIIVRYLEMGTATPRIGSYSGETLRRIEIDSLGALMELELDKAKTIVLAASEVVSREVLFLPPIDGATEVWASGVTYVRSREARTEESTMPSVYEQVYEAERPELFFKSTAWRVVGPDAAIGIRADSALNVPEPELAVVVNSSGDIFGYTVSNDVSSRSLEGENPLYLPQAKIYAGSSAIGPGIRPVWEISDARGLSIEVTVERATDIVWQGSTSVDQMHRQLSELVGFLTRADFFPQGAILSTGTGLVPSMDFSLEAGDKVKITITEIGTLTNSVVVGKSDFQDLWKKQTVSSSE